MQEEVGVPDVYRTGLVPLRVGTVAHGCDGREEPDSEQRVNAEESAHSQEVTGFGRKRSKEGAQGRDVLRERSDSTTANQVELGKDKPKLKLLRHHVDNASRVKWIFKWLSMKILETHDKKGLGKQQYHMATRDAW